MAELIRFFGQILQWILEVVLWWPLVVWELILIGLAETLNAIPVPDWLVGADPFSVLDPGVVFFAEAFEIPAGIGIILGAYAIRFLIRRIPIIG